MFAKFEYTAPATVEELLGILAQEKAGTVIYGGGTDVIVDLRSEKLQAERLIDIKNPAQKTVEALMNLDLPAGVEIEIKL